MLELEKQFAKRILKDEMMKNHTTFKIGGPAKYFLEINSGEELIEVIKLINKDGLNYIIIGNGSNLLVSDAGFDGVVIRILDIECQISSDNKLKVGAGLKLGVLSQFAFNQGLTGLEWAIGVPGTVGGAIVMNAGCFGQEMKDSVVSVDIFSNNPEDGIKELTNEQCGFKYRESIFKEHPEWIILGAELKLDNGEQKKIKNKMNEFLGLRNEKLPLDKPSAGSIFKKYKIFEGEKLNEKLERILQKEHPEFLNGKYIPAGWLISEAGLGGKKIGGALVSEKHTNFIINTQNAKAEDVIILIALIKEKIRNEFGIQLQEEVIYLGF